MKKLLYILSVLALTASCNFLDFDESSSQYSREDMYKTYSNIQKMLANIYGYLPNKDIADVSSALRDCGSDDAEYADPDASVQRFTNGNWSPIATVDDKWSLYNGVRSANEFLESIKTVDLSMYRFDTKYQRWLEHLQYYPAQARVLRAYFFFELARRYGDIAMPLTMLTAEEANAIPKTPFNEVIDFVVKECEESAAELPKTYVGLLDDEVGRITNGFALAVKAKALLYAASPLHNPSGDREKWRAAAQAAKDIMDLNQYSLDPAEKANNAASPEVIFAISRSESQSFERYNFPVRFTEGERTSIAGTYPSQQLVDAFQTLGGYDITLGNNGWSTADPDFNLDEPYEGRDPRFARAILANGMSFKGHPQRPGYRNGLLPAPLHPGKHQLHAGKHRDQQAPVDCLSLRGGAAQLCRGRQRGAGQSYGCLPGHECPGGPEPGTRQRRHAQCDGYVPECLP